jgi:hypothetical protein
MMIVPRGGIFIQYDLTGVIWGYATSRTRAVIPAMKEVNGLEGLAGRTLFAAAARILNYQEIH